MNILNLNQLLNSLLNISNVELQILPNLALNRSQVLDLFGNADIAGNTGYQYLPNLQWMVVQNLRQLIKESLDILLSIYLWLNRVKEACKGISHFGMRHLSTYRKVLLENRVHFFLTISHRI